MAAGVCYGSTDVDLAGDPGPCAQRLNSFLPAQLRVISSPARRCLQLAQRLNASPRIDERLREIHFGEWEMRRYDEIPRTSLDAWAADPLAFRPPCGETAGEMQTRVRAALVEHLADAGEALAIVAHGGPLRAIAGELLGHGPADWFSMPFAFGRCTRIDWSGGRATLVWQNR